MKSIIIGVAGGSGSGKSTFTNRIKKYFGDDVVVLYHDNYYRSQDSAKKEPCPFRTMAPLNSLNNVSWTGFFTCPAICALAVINMCAEIIHCNCPIRTGLLAFLTSNTSNLTG